MNIEKLNKICYTICVCCIVLGTVLSLAMIWGPVSSDFAYKSWLTIAIFFGAGILTLGVNSMIGKGKDKASTDREE